MSDQDYQYNFDNNSPHRVNENLQAQVRRPSMSSFGLSIVHGSTSGTEHQGLDSSLAFANETFHGNQNVASYPTRSRSSSYSQSSLQNNNLATPGTPLLPAFRSSSYSSNDIAASNTFPFMSPLGSHQSTLSGSPLSSEVSFPKDHGRAWSEATSYLPTLPPIGPSASYQQSIAGGPGQSWSEMIYHGSGNFQQNNMPSVLPHERHTPSTPTTIGAHEPDYPYSPQAQLVSPIYRHQAQPAGTPRLVSLSPSQPALEHTNILPLPLSYPSPSPSATSEGNSASSGYFAPRNARSQLPPRHASYPPSVIAVPPTQQFAPIHIVGHMSHQSFGSERLLTTDSLPPQAGREWAEWRDDSARYQSERLQSTVATPDSGHSVSNGHPSSLPSPFGANELNLSPAMDGHIRSPQSLKRPLHPDLQAAPEPLPNRRRYKTTKSGAASEIPHVHALNIVCNHPRCLLSASGAISLEQDPSESGTAKRPAGKKGRKEKEKVHLYECAYVEPSTGVPCDSKFKRRGCRDRHSSSHSGKESKDVSVSCLTLGLARRLLWETCRLIEEKDWSCLFLRQPQNITDPPTSTSPEYPERIPSQDNYAEATKRIEEEFDIDILTHQAASVQDLLKAVPFSDHQATGVNPGLVPLVDLSIYHQFSRMALKRSKTFERYFCTEHGCEVDFTRLDALLRHSRTCHNHNSKKRGKRQESSRGQDDESSGEDEDEDEED